MCFCCPSTSHQSSDATSSNHHFLKWAGTLQYAFLCSAGVRQGCPLSSALFVIVCDPILRALRAQVPERCLLRGYADDLAMVLHNLWSEAPGIALLFATVSQISCLSLNGKKCVIVPLWRYNAHSLRKLLSEFVPLWRGFEIAATPNSLVITLALMTFKLDGTRL